MIYNNPDMFGEIKRAWAVWISASQSFSSQLDSNWGYDKQSNTTSKRIQNKKDNFVEEMAIRLQHCQIECADALYIIASRDTENSFFYCDPPYYNSNCGHYDGYSEQDFEALLFLLGKIKGKFLLSSYPSELLARYTKQHGWFNWSIEQPVSVNAKAGNQKNKVEMLTANYPFHLEGGNGATAAQENSVDQP